MIEKLKLNTVFDTQHFLKSTQRTFFEKETLALSVYIPFSEDGVDRGVYIGI